jgi:hypothetical protein
MRDAERSVTGLRARFRACYKPLDSDAGPLPDGARLTLKLELGPDGTVARVIPTPDDATTRAVAECVLRLARQIEPLGDAGVIRVPAIIHTAP